MRHSSALGRVRGQRSFSFFPTLTTSLFVVTGLAALSCSPSPDGSMPDPGAVCTDCTPTGTMVGKLPSPAGAVIWTAPTTEKLLREAAPPPVDVPETHIYAAKHEFERFQIAVRADAAKSVTLSMPAFAPAGAAAGGAAIDRIELRRVDYVKISQPSDASSIKSSYIPDPLTQVRFGLAETAPAGQNQPFWITVYVPEGASPGDYKTTLHVDVGGNGVDIPVKLHVYNFALPRKLGFDGQWNSSFQALGGSASLAAVEKLKTFFFEHRLTPTSVSWPAGLNYNGGIVYDCATGTFSEKPSDPYDFSQLGPKYIDGKGWNGVGFPSFQIMQFVNNSTPRPDPFCGVARGPDQYGTAAYNAAWSKLLGAIDSYLGLHNWQGKGYYYVQNEPQNQADYDLAAYLANLTKTAAPNLRIAVSEEPKPEIAENPKANGKSYDIWMADLSAFKADYAKLRQAKGENVWWYFLYGDLPPNFNPITIDHSGIETRIPFWGAWRYRISGFAYYSTTGWGSDPYNNPRPMGTAQNGDGFLLYPPVSGELVSSIRWELLREGTEDFEYFLLANGGSMPKTPDLAAVVDTTVGSAVTSPTAYTRDTSALQDLRNQLGLKIEGKANGWPVLMSKPIGAHPRASYFLNFQDPAGDPKASPLIVNGQEWKKIGWDPYDQKLGYGWFGPFIGNATIMKYAYAAAAPNELQRSIIYNDYGRTDTFNWDIENGRYKVTVSIGWQGKTYAKNRVVVEGQVLFDNYATTPTNSYAVQSVVVDVKDGNVTMEAGQFNEYTMLNYMSIEPAP